MFYQRCIKMLNFNIQNVILTQCSVKCYARFSMNKLPVQEETSEDLQMTVAYSASHLDEQRRCKKASDPPICTTCRCQTDRCLTSNTEFVKLMQKCNKYRCSGNVQILFKFTILVKVNSYSVTTRSILQFLRCNSTGVSCCRFSR